jgi:hypothetical protein
LAGQLSFGNETLVVEGILEGIVARMDGEGGGEGGREGGREEVVQRMVGMVGEHLGDVVGKEQQERRREGGGEGGGKRQVMVEQDLERLTTIIRVSEPRLMGRRGGGREGEREGGTSPAVGAVQSLLPVLQAIYDEYKGKPDVMEKVRRVHYLSLPSSLPLSHLPSLLPS